MSKSSYRPKNITELKLLKQQLRSNVRLEEEVIGFGIERMRNTFADAAKSAAKIYLQGLAIKLLTKVVQSRMRIK
ncbi:MAG: hypothetical protein KQH79_15305 [Bacteroidetes bacterium]|nr:hypothetical protein [Bacteroidota bacterium]